MDKNAWRAEKLFTLDKQNETELNTYGNSAEHSLEQLEAYVLEAERLMAEAAKLARKMLADRGETSELTKASFENIQKDICQVSAEWNEFGVKITTPQLVPHRKRIPEPYYIEVLHTALTDLKRETCKNDPEHWEAYWKSVQDGAVLAIKMTYGGRWRARDNDNVELKFIIDSLWQRGFIEEDSGDYLHLYIGAETKEHGTSQTMFQLMPKRCFAEWLQRVENK